MNIYDQSSDNTLAAEAFFNFPSFIPNELALLGGIIAGLVYSKRGKEEQALAFKLEAFVDKILLLITILIPFFVAGFIVKMRYDGIIMDVMHNYSAVFFIITLSALGYIFLLFQFIHSFHVPSTLYSLKHMFPAMLSALGTMSSAASMPLTIIGVDSSARHPDVSHTVVPATVNIHLIGDCVAIPCFAYAIMKNYGVPIPDFSTYMIFVAYFVMAKFSVAAVPGGGILVMLPILEKYLSFNAEMLSLITALYILFDPIITSLNVLGNGAFALIMDKTLSIPAPIDEYLENNFDEEEFYDDSNEDSR